MTKYEPGRVYSGVVNGERKGLLRRCQLWADGEKFYLNDQVTDVRGPLVVLDLDDMGFPPGIAVVALRADGAHTSEWIADQIEEQTRPPLQTGWHEVEERSRPVYYDGSKWSYGRLDPAECLGPITSKHYIGPGSED